MKLFLLVFIPLFSYAGKSIGPYQNELKLLNSIKVNSCDFKETQFTMTIAMQPMLPLIIPILSQVATIPQVRVSKRVMILPSLLLELKQAAEMI